MAHARHQESGGVHARCGKRQRVLVSKPSEHPLWKFPVERCPRPQGWWGGRSFGRVCDLSAQPGRYRCHSVVRCHGDLASASHPDLIPDVMAPDQRDLRVRFAACAVSWHLTTSRDKENVPHNSVKNFISSAPFDIEKYTSLVVHITKRTRTLELKTE